MYKRVILTRARNSLGYVLAPIIINTLLATDENQREPCLVILSSSGIVL